jgi:hypothetical protein
VALSETFRLKTALAKDITSQRQTQMTELRPATLYTALAVSNQHSAFSPLEVCGNKAVDDLRPILAEC